MQRTIIKHVCFSHRRVLVSINNPICQFHVRWKRTEPPKRKNSQQHLLRDLYKRRIEAGPEPVRPRSHWPNWNYESELYCFGQRLGEDFNADTLRTAFTHRSYVEKQKEETILELEPEKLADNTALIELGDKLMDDFVKAYLRHHFPNLPEECICSVHNHLTSTSTLFYITSNLGFKDLIQAKEFPPSEKIMADTFRAIVGGLSSDQGKDRAEKFIQDFVMTQLISLDINEHLGIVNPMGLLASLLIQDGRGPPEPRLIHSSGESNIQAVYMVGIYSDKKLVGKSYGESPMIAEEMAARDALRKVFETTIHREPLAYKEPAQLHPSNYKENYRVPEHFSNMLQ